MQKSLYGPETARTYPLCLLEWTANRKKANMVLQVHCFDGESSKSLLESSGFFQQILEKEILLCQISLALGRDYLHCRDVSLHLIFSF